MDSVVKKVSKITISRKEVKRKAKFDAHDTRFFGSADLVKTPADEFVDIPSLIERLKKNDEYGFVYLTYAVDRSSKYFNPYCFKVVSYKEVDKSYYLTMSKHGVLQHEYTNVEFISLAEWERDYTYYTRIMQLKTFRQFRLWKSFHIWHKGIQKKKFTNAANNLDKKLCILNVHFATALIVIRTRCLKLAGESMFETTRIEMLTLDDFYARQLQRVDAVRETLMMYHGRSKEVVLVACQNALRGEDFSVDDSNLKPHQLMAETIFRKNKDGKMSYTEQLRKRRVCERISRFINLTDCLTIQMLNKVLVNSMKNFQTAIDQFKSDETDAFEPFILIDVDIDETGLVFNPSLDLIHQTIIAIIDDWHSVVYDVTSFSSDSIFDGFTSPKIGNQNIDRLIGRGPSLQTLLKLNVDLDYIHRYLDAYMMENLQLVSDYSFKLDGLRQFYVANLNETGDLWESETDLNTFKALLERFQNELNLLECVQLNENVGIFHVNLTAVVQKIRPESKRLMERIFEFLPEIGRGRVLNLYGSVNESVLTLEKSLITAMDYINYLLYLDNVSQQIETMLDDFEYSKKLYTIVDEYRINVPPMDLISYTNVQAALEKLKKLAQTQIANKQDIISKLNDVFLSDSNELKNETLALNDYVYASWLIDDETTPESALKSLMTVREKLQSLQTRANEIRKCQKQYKLEMSEFEQLDQFLADVYLRISLWETQQIWRVTLNDWYASELIKLNCDDMSLVISKISKTLTQLEKGLPSNKIVPELRGSVETIKEKLPVLGYLNNPSLKPRHFLQIETVLNCKFTPDVTLEFLDTHNVTNFSNELQEITGQASSEAALEVMLKKVEANWDVVEFPVVAHKDSKDVFILGSLEEIVVILEESLVTLNTINSSRHAGPIKTRVDEWLKQLNLLTEIIDQWMNCQQQWIYLKAIFSAPDIQRQLPNESKMFAIVDKSWNNLMRRTVKIPLVITAANIPTLKSLKNCNELLEQIIKCLEAYLEVKRSIFPRFYFLSNDELLEILAQTRNPYAVQPHLRKCFDAISRLQFKEKEATTESSGDGKSSEALLTTDIIAMLSPEGERVALIGKSGSIKARGNVEEWLCKVEEAMFHTLQRIMKNALGDYLNRSRFEWIKKYPSQIVLTVSQIHWARNVHAILDSSDSVKHLEVFEKKCFQNLNELAALVRENLDSVLRKIIIALITIDVHARDTISDMVKNRVCSSHDFGWLKAIRYYWNDERDVVVARMSNAEHTYGYEYLGAAGCLVITPLTDKCYLCLMGALQLDLGGAPAGPAGTGKTETTKDLAKSLAIQCVVFNCSEGLDYHMMGRFFAGLAQSGAWCCFDEFNRIDIEVLSVIAQQLITIRNAKVARVSRFMFEGREIKLVRQCAAFITMNPGYAGRTELPDNLKALFRPISMMVPDYALIAEVILYSEGFESAKILARKMTQMYKLCSEQLSQQDHYDFGMRAVKSVLVSAGILKRAAVETNTSEEIVLIRALCDSNLPKFLTEDALLFQGILSDLFPSVIVPERNYGVFQNAIEHVIDESALQVEECQVAKVIQLHETMIVRWGVMLVGPTGGGKSTVLNMLAKALTKLHSDNHENEVYQPVHLYVLNPKAISLSELYGEVNQFTLEWHDGLLGTIVRSCVQFTDCDHQWIVCDGPVDALWIENLNTVLDDNKMLCLANSERIKLTPYMHFVFEVEDLSQASPATVSRCGMVYIDPNEIKWLPFVRSWIQKSIFSSVSTLLLDLFDQCFQLGFDFVKRIGGFAIRQVDIGKASMCCALLESLIISCDLSENTNQVDYVEKAFVFAFIWSVAGNLNEQSRREFEIIMRENDGFQRFRMPNESLWDVYLDPSTKNFENWSCLTPEFIYDPTLPFFEILVPTLDTTCYSYLMKQCLLVNKPVMLTGYTGVGKSIIAKSVFTNATVNLPIFVNFSAQTSSERVQEILEQKLEKKKKTLLGAPIGKKFVVFVDDVNMPKVDTYGSQAPIELLRQILDYNGLYDRDKLFWKDIVDMTLTCACAPPGGGRNPLTPRFVRHFGMIFISSLNENSMKVIFKAILGNFFNEFVDEIIAVTDNVVNAAVEIYQRVSLDFLPTPTKSHYVFNLRDLFKCIQGLMQADSASVRSVENIEKLFYHECLRVFHDRLTTREDQDHFYATMSDVCQKHFNNPVIPVSSNERTKVMFYGDFVMPPSRVERIYEEIKDVDKLKNVLQDFLDDYNMLSPKTMQLIFFTNAIEHCLRLARILRTERGNGLLVGVSGMGKQSLTRLASHINDAKCFQIELTNMYDHASFLEDLRAIFINAGVKNERTVFLFTDAQILQEDFLEDINNVLTSGDVPNLFEGDEYEKLLLQMIDIAKNVGITDNRDAIYELFLSRVRSNLHTMLCMSPIGESFRRRCRMFPALINCCTIDWFFKWPFEAFMSVAENYFDTDLSNEPVLKSNLAEVCVLIHESVDSATEIFYEEMRRRYYTTPSNFLQLLKLYQKTYISKKEKITKAQERVQNGLKKLYETNSVVDVMKAEVEAFEPQLKAKSKIVSELVETLNVEKKSADEVRTMVKKEEESAQVKAAECQEIADDAQRDLETAMPAMRAASKALEALNKNDINEVKSFQKPPRLVQFVMETICILFSSKTDWDSAKRILADINFLKKLQEYDKNHIPEKILRKIEPYITHKEFVPEIVETASKVCKSLCLFVHALFKYAQVYKVVEPKIKRHKNATEELQSVMMVLKEKQRQLATVESQILQLEESYQMSLDEMTKLQASKDLTSARLQRASQLTFALGDEQERWEQLNKDFNQMLANLRGDVLICAAFVAYLGAFSKKYRDDLLNHWLNESRLHQLPLTDHLNFIKLMADPFDIRTWNICGLPKDVTSTENAIICTNCDKWPLLIDPQEQANRWIKNLEKDNHLKVIKLNDGNFLRTIETSIRIGTPVLLQDVDEKLDPTLGSVLNKAIFTSGGRTMIHFGDTDIEYDTNFRFYMTTKLPNPHYLPEICITVTLINFTVTPLGLEDQLLADVVRLERPDLENSRAELIVRISEDKNRLEQIEDKILKLLFASTGNILDDSELINTLNESKETSSIILSRLSDTEATEEKIFHAREKYRCVAARGSLLYFVVTDLAAIDPMYQYSLKYYNTIFNTVIEMCEKCEDLQTRLTLLAQNITQSVYTNISRGLFERHKLIFSFMLCLKILEQNGEITKRQINFILRGVDPNDLKDLSAKNKNIEDSVWKYLRYLELNFKNFEGLLSSGTFRLRLGDYNEEINLNVSGGNENDWNTCLSDFEKLMLIKCVREEKLVNAIIAFIRVKLGNVFVESPLITLNYLYKDISNVTPLVFILSTGSDPFAAFQKFAIEMDKLERIQSISLGQGQGPIAENILKLGKQRGDWVFFQNCHLATSWMPSLERLVQNLPDETIHPEFRLFLSSMPSEKFPVSVLQSSVKVTNEPPKGIRANVKRAFMEIDRNFFEKNALGDNWRRLLFGICMFHAVILERKKFGALGWNTPYEFSENDRDCALLNIDAFCADSNIPWDALEYITGEITYGGRVTDYWDLRCLKTILQSFFSPKIFDKMYTYSPSGIYYCPPFPTLDEHRQFVDEFPVIDDPEIFGMHDNANIVFQINEANAIKNAVLSCQPRATLVSSGKTSDQVVSELSESIRSTVLEKIACERPFGKLMELDKKGRIASISTVLLQEIDRYNVLLSLIHKSLNELDKAIRGQVVMSELLEGVYTSLLNNQVPKLWSDRSYPSLKSLASWLNDLKLRVNFILNWYEHGPSQSFWLSGFYFPQGFLTAVLQTYARLFEIPIDTLTYDFKVTNVFIDQEKGEIGDERLEDIKTTTNSKYFDVIIHGLYVDAGSWNNVDGVLVDSKLGEMNCPLPAIRLIPKTFVPADSRYSAPLYKTSIRAGVLSTTGHSTNFVIAILLPTKKSSAHWILRGTALLTQITN